MLMSGGETFFGCECSSLEAGAAAETEAKLSAVLEIMRPKPSPFELLRIGGGRDGAYLVPDDLKTVKICFSPGVSNRKRFEDQLTADYGMTCHMCDYSSDETKFATPLIPGKQTFDKLWLEPRAGADQIDLRSWIDKFYPGGCGDLMLQMDIEGAEYRNILAADLPTLARFRIMVLEVHGLGKLTSAPVLHSVLYPFFSKIGALFTCIHAHTNNHSDEIFIRGNQINLSDAIELTFLRTDVLPPGPARDLRPVLLPHPLDITNAQQKKPIVLSKFWCGGARPFQSRKKILEDQFAYQRARIRHRIIRANKAIRRFFKPARSGSVSK